MRVLVFPLPLQGHLQPLLPTIASLRARDAEVAAATTPETAAALGAAGATAVPSPPGFQARVGEPSENFVEVAADLAAATEDGALAFALAAVRDRRPDVVVCDSMAPWGLLAARIAGVPVVTSTSSFVVHAGIGRTPRAVADLARRGVAGARALARIEATRRRLRRTHGVDPGGVVGLLSNRGDATVVHTTRALQPGAARFGADVHFVGAPLRDAGASAPWLEALGGQRLLYVSLGTVFNDRPDFLRACLDAFAHDPRTVVLSAGAQVDARALGPLPANAQVHATVPQVHVLRHADLFVTHGGLNSASEALALGVPMLLFPQSADQPIVSGRIQALGAGRVLRGRRPSPEAIRRTAARVGASDAARRALAVGAELGRGGGPSAAAEIVLAASAAGYR